MRASNFLMGLVSGAVLGVLFAPEKGRKSRKTIVKAARNVNGTIKKWLGKESSELDELKAVLADESIMLTESDRKKLVQLIENNQKVLKELDV